MLLFVVGVNSVGMRYICSSLALAVAIVGLLVLIVLLFLVYWWFVCCLVLCFWIDLLPKVLLAIWCCIC